ncbi:MAG: signal peptidase II [Hyphomicrobiaceae bacterium]|nr:signal peptidase II [Hyphomicrobiaceae bacterium]
MPIGLGKARLLSVAIGSDALILDRVHKFFQIEIQGWHGGEFVPVTPFFNYVLVWNPGVSYSLLVGVPKALIYLVIGMAAALLLLWWWRAARFLTLLGLAFCLFGAASNFIDRLIYGAVADFFHFHWGAWSFYVFNVADMGITLGAILLIGDLIFSPPERKA